MEFGWIGGSFPHPGLSALPKFLLVDSTLYAFLVVRRLEGVGYDFRARVRDLVIGLRECSFFAPIAIALGIGIGFIVPHGGNAFRVIGVGCAAGHTSSSLPSQKSCSFGVCSRICSRHGLVTLARCS